MRSSCAQSSALANTAVDASERTWVADRVAAHWGTRPDTLIVEPVDSRTSSVMRVRMVVDGEPRVVFLKRCERPRSFPTLTDYFDTLRKVMSEIERHGAFAALEILGTDADLGLLMTAPVPGTTLGTLISRRAALTSLAGAPTALSTVFAALAGYLAILHRTGARSSTGHARRVAAYIRVRFEAWADADVHQRDLARRASMRLTDLTAHADRTEAGLVPCHGDVTPHNVVLGERLGLIDWDDLRWDFASSDLSQVVLGIRQLSWLQRVRAGRERPQAIEAAFRQAYGAWPDDVTWQLAHLRNLAVYLTTLASQRHTEGGWAQWQTERQYRLLTHELAAVLDRETLQI